MANKSVSAQLVIKASPEKIFDLLADPAKHSLIDGSGSVKAGRPGNPKRLSLGAKFSMDMRIKLPYRISNTVVEFEENRRIAWCHYAHNIWRYELEPVDGGTRVTETSDFSNVRGAWLIARMGYPKKNQAAMESTLERLAQVMASA
jgi:hypothetical protein